MTTTLKPGQIIEYDSHSNGITTGVVSNMTWHRRARVFALRDGGTVQLDEADGGRGYVQADDPSIVVISEFSYDGWAVKAPPAPVVPVIPTHAVVDPCDGMTFTTDWTGTPFTAETAAAFAAQRNEGLRSDLPRYLVMTLTPAAG